MYRDNDIGIEGNKLSVSVDINFGPRKSKSWKKSTLGLGGMVSGLSVIRCIYKNYSFLHIKNNQLKI